MPDTTVVHLLRHGEVSNPSGVLYGRLPGFHLSAEGEHMAKAAADSEARGHEAVCVSHQLAIWVARKSAEKRRLWHHPARRECALGSVTSFTYRDDVIVGISYAEPAGHRGGDHGA